MTATTIFTDLSEQEAVSVLSYRLSQEGVASSDIREWIHNAKYVPLNYIWQELQLQHHMKKLAMTKQSAVLAIYQNDEKSYYYI